MTSKALREGTSRSRSEGVRAREHSSRGGEYTRTIWEADVLGCVPRDGKGSVVRISRVVIGIGRIDSSGGGRSR